MHQVTPNFYAGLKESERGLAGGGQTPAGTARVRCEPGDARAGAGREPSAVVALREGEERDGGGSVVTHFPEVWEVDGVGADGGRLGRPVLALRGF
jgi:hypothetical protein